MHIVFSPIWFMGIDSVFEILAALISLLVGAYSFRIYRSTGKKQFKYLFVAFALIFLSFISRSVTDIMAYSLFLESMPMITRIMNVQYVYLAGIYVYQLLMMGAYMTLVALSLKIRNKRVFSLLVLFILISSVAGLYNYSIFHMVSSVLLFYVVFHFYENYRKRKSCNSLAVFLAFLMILVSQVTFIFITNMMFYVVGHFLQFAGYLLLLINIILVRRS